jgi:hypothetical protein
MVLIRLRMLGVWRLGITVTIVRIAENLFEHEVSGQALDTRPRRSFLSYRQLAASCMHTPHAVPGTTLPLFFICIFFFRYFLPSSPYTSLTFNHVYLFIQFLQIFRYFFFSGLISEFIYRVFLTVFLLSFVCFEYHGKLKMLWFWRRGDILRLCLNLGVCLTQSKPLVPHLHLMCNVWVHTHTSSHCEIYKQVKLMIATY